MSKKIYIDNNYLVVEDSTSGRIDLSEPKSEVRAFVQDAEVKIRLKSDRSFYKEYKFSDLVDSEDSAFANEDALNTFFRENTGFSTALGGSSAAETTYDNSDSNIPGTNVKEALDYLDSKTDFRGDLAIADTPATDGYYFATETGTYTNAGSLVTDLTQGLNIIIKESTNYSLVVIPLNGLTADEQSVLGVDDVSYQLYDSADDIENKTWFDGSLLNISGRDVSDYYPVSEGDYVNVYTDVSTVSQMVLLDSGENVVATLRTPSPDALNFRVKIPSGVSFISWNTAFSNVTRTSNYFKSEFDITTKFNDTFSSGLSGDFDSFRKIREELKLQLKGRSIAPDPYFKNFDINTQYVPLAFWATTTVEPIAFVNNDNYTLTKVSNVPKYGTGLRVSRDYDNNLRALDMKIDSQYLINKGVENGDNVRIGFWVKADQVPDKPINIFFNEKQINAVTDTSWTWVEGQPQAFNSSLDHFEYLMDLNSFQSAAAGAETFVMTGLTVINETDNLWLGYEENNNYVLEQAVTDALSGGITPEIESVLESNTTIRDLMNEQHYGAYIADFREQLRTMIDYWGKPADAINITFLADSILFGTDGVAEKIADWLLAEFGIPLDNVNLDGCWGGYSSSEYLRVVEQSVIRPNADLVIISEAGGQAALEQMIKLIQSKSSADIVIGTWTKYTNDPVYETEGQYNQLRDLAHRYGCELWDINALLVRAIADGDFAQYYRDVLHLSANGEDLLVDDFKKRLVNNRFYNEYNKGITKREVIQLASDFNVPLDNVAFSGSWSGNVVANFLQSSTSGDYIEIPFTGTGIEVLFDTQSASHTILLDGAAPSAYVDSGRYLEYCTQIVGKTQTEPNWQFHRFFKAEVSAPFLTNSEDSLEFEIEIDAIQRDGSSNVTGVDYTLSVNDGGWTSLGTGNINTDETFTLRTTGEITIPSQVFGLPNFFENPTGDPEEPGSGYVFTVGDTMQFFAKKTWVDTFNSTDTLLSIKGLNRGAHTLRITKADSNLTEVRLAQIFK